MLVRFTVGNFKSINKNQTLSLISGLVQNHKERLYKCKDFKLLKFATLFGANAAGKSNFIKAIDFAQSLVILSFDFPNVESIKYDYFRLEPSNKILPSYFEFEFLINNQLYAYGFEVILSQKKVTEEWLIKLTKEKDEPIFIRKTQSSYFYFSEKYNTSSVSLRMSVYMDDYKNVDSSLFLKEIVTNKDELYKSESSLNILRDVYFAIKGINISYPDTPITGYDCFTNDNIKSLLSTIKTFNTGITNIKQRVITKEQALEGFSLNTQQMIEDDITALCSSNSPKGGFRMNANGRLVFVTLEDNKPVFTEVNFEHFNNEKVLFSLSDESDGTQRLLDLISVLFTQKEDSIFVIDELDRSLHPVLTKEFIKLYLNIAEKKNIQLIITTHESYILNLDLLRQDEVFFIESDNSGESRLYPLDRFKERFDKKIEKAYLDGRYGAIPIFDYSNDYH